MENCDLYICRPCKRNSGKRFDILAGSVTDRTMVLFYRADGPRRVDGAGAALGDVLPGEQSHVHQPDHHLHPANRRQVPNRL